MAIVTGQQILAADAIKLGAGIYGNGADGNVTINVDTDLVRDMYYDTLTVNNTKTLSTKGFRIFAKTAVINAGTIDHTGGNGGNGVAGTGGAAGVGAVAGSLAAGGAGGIGVSDATDGSASGGGGGGGGIIFIAAETITNTGTIRANGGNAGTSLAAVGSAPAAANGTNVAVFTNALGSKGGAGGNANSSTGGTTTSTTAPAASEGGFKDVVSLRNLRLSSAFTQVAGGSGGGSGAYDSSDPAAAGGSGGGGGGLIILLYRNITLGTVTVTGGAHSDGAVTGLGTKTDGADGTTGTIIQLIA